jgi:hypothetical protein
MHVGHKQRSRSRPPQGAISQKADSLASQLSVQSSELRLA